MPYLHEVASFLDACLGVQDYPEERNGVLADTAKPLRRIGLALEPDASLRHWVQRFGLDALILHRAWRLDLGLLPPGIGLLAYHLPFDEHLTLGWNPLLAGVLGLTDLEVLGTKQGRPIGMIGRVEDADFVVLRGRIERELGGVEEVVLPRKETVARIAVMGAMTEALVREAAARGAAVYVTGQLRVPARQAVEETGIGVIATGHRRSEEWGLRMLADVLRSRWPDLEVFTQKA